MITRGNRRAVQPLLITYDATSKPKTSTLNTSKLERVPFEELIFDEKEVKDLIEQNPEILPVGEIEPVFRPLISIGRELGEVDHLFINPQGDLTIVEAKLWRNTESARKVLAQIIDYAAKLSQWTYDKLDNEVKKYNSAGLGILDYIRSFQGEEEIDETVIIDNIYRNLKAGRFLLLIVGDGIRESLETMVDYLQTTPHLQFTLALVEMQFYKFPEKESSLLMVPEVIARTSEIERALIRFDIPENVKYELVKPKEPMKTTSGKVDISLEGFYSGLSGEYIGIAQKIEEDMRKRNCIIDPQKNSYQVRLPDPGGSGIDFSLFGVSKQGGLTPGNWNLLRQLKSLSLSDDAAIEFGENTAKLLGVGLKKDYPGVWVPDPDLKVVSGKYPQFLNEIDILIDKITKAALPGE